MSPPARLRSGGAVAEYRALLRAIVDGRAAEAKAASARLFAGGEPALAVYRVSTRIMLPRVASAPQRAGTSRLDALRAAMLLSAYLPSSEAHRLLSRATGWAASAVPPHAAAPTARPWPPTAPTALPAKWSEESWAELVRADITRGDGAAAEWALSQLLAGPNRGSLPTIASRQAAYSALFAASAEHAGAGWGRLLHMTASAAETADLLPPSLTFLALRPALWAIARTAVRPPSHADQRLWRGASDAGCALRLNRRAARPGETAEWARALRSGQVDRVVDEALASGLSAPALMDAAILAALAAGGVISPGELHGHKACALLAFHAARRAHSLADHSATPFFAALGLLGRLPRLPRVRLARRLDPTGAASGAGWSIETIARTAAHHATPHSVVFGAAITGEYAEARERSPEYAAALLRGAATWLGLSELGDDAPSRAHRAS